MTRISRRTIAVAYIGLGIIAALAAIILFSHSERVGLVVSDIGEAAVVCASAVVIFLAARGLGVGTLRRNWMLIGLGVASFGIGDVIWAIIEVGMGKEVPYPGVPDVFYLLEYVFLGAGIALAGLAYRRLVPVRKPLVIALTVTVLIAGLLWFTFISPLVVAGEWNPESILSAIYPLADIILLFGPALFIVLIVAQLGGGRLGWPWLAVGGGALVLAFSDSVYSYLSAIDVYQSGMAVDYGWMVAHVLIALGALIAQDLSRPAVETADA
jgi:hypothetical protein